MAIVIPYVKQTWTDGSGGGTPVSAARLGVLEEGILDISQAPCARVTHNTTQSATSGTPLTISFNTERFDQAGGASSTQHDNTTNNSRLTALYAGVYAIWGHIEWASNATGFRQVYIRVNGSTIIGTSTLPTTIASVMQMSVSSIYSLAVNDYVELVGLQNSGGGLNINSTANLSPEFGFARVG